MQYWERLREEGSCLKRKIGLRGAYLLEQAALRVLQSSLSSGLAGEEKERRRGAWKHLVNSCTDSPIRSSSHSPSHSLFSSISSECLHGDITAFNYSRWLREKLWLLTHSWPRAWTQRADVQTQQRNKYGPACASCALKKKYRARHQQLYHYSDK